MNYSVWVALGCFFFLLGLGYLYRPDILERIRVFLRDVVLNDAYIHLERRQWGLFFLLLSLFCLYIGYMSMQGWR